MTMFVSLIEPRPTIGTRRRGSVMLPVYNEYLALITDNSVNSHLLSTDILYTCIYM